MRRLFPFVLMLGLIIVVTACGGERQPSEGAFHPEDFAVASIPDRVYDPVKSGERLPGGFRQLLARDAIEPIYNPLFVEGSASPWPDDELIIGVDLAGEARAYPVGYLNRREIVVDLHKGIPTFVTW